MRKIFLLALIFIILFSAVRSNQTLRTAYCASNIPTPCKDSQCTLAINTAFTCFSEKMCYSFSTFTEISDCIKKTCSSSNTEV